MLTDSSECTEEEAAKILNSMSGKRPLTSDDNVTSKSSTENTQNIDDSSENCLQHGAEHEEMDQTNEDMVPNTADEMVSNTADDVGNLNEKSDNTGPQTELPPGGCTEVVSEN